jgi:hypothetical protein
MCVKLAYLFIVVPLLLDCDKPLLCNMYSNTQANITNYVTINMTVLTLRCITMTYTYMHNHSSRSAER